MSSTESLRFPEKGVASRIAVTVDDQGNRFVNGLPVIGERVVHQNGSFTQVELIVKGPYDSLGRVIDGLTGKETAVPQTRLRATRVFPVQK